MGEVVLVVDEVGQDEYDEHHQLMVLDEMQEYEHLILLVVPP